MHTQHVTLLRGTIANQKAQTMAQTREAIIADIQTKYAEFYRIGGTLGLVVVGIWLGTLFALGDYASDMFSEALGVLVTIIVLDRLNAIRQRQREEEALKRRLVREAGSRDNERALSAIDWLRAEGWLTDDGSLLKDALLNHANLRGSNLEGANLEGADLANANLSAAILREVILRDATLIAAQLQQADLWVAQMQRADLQQANLKQADLYKANLEDARLDEANFQGATMGAVNLRGATLEATNLQQADLEEADLREANLWEADLRGADMWSANMQGATLHRANLRGASNLQTAFFDAETVLPDAEYIGKADDGTLLYDRHWSPDVDMTRYSNPDHPNFWEREM